MMDIRPVKIIFVSSLSDARYMWNCGKEKAIEQLKKAYGQDFGFDQKAWLRYMLANDDDFVSELHEIVGGFPLEPFMYEILKEDGRFKFDKVWLMEHPIEQYDHLGRRKPEYLDENIEDKS